jgi:hypothetical protein
MDKDILAILERIEQRLTPRVAIDETIFLSDTQGWQMDYRGRRYVFLWNPGAELTLNLGEYGQFLLPSQSWTQLDIRPGIKIFTTGQSTPTPVVIRFTDDLLLPNDFSSIGTPADQAWSGTGTGSEIAILKKIATNQAGPYMVEFPSPQPIEGSFTEIAGNGANVTGVGTDLIPATDVSSYKSFSLQLSGTFSATLQVQVSNDNVNFYALLLGSYSVTLSNYLSLSAPGLWTATIGFRYLRVRCTTFTSNTSLAGTLELYTWPIPMNSEIGLLQVGQSSTPWVMANDSYSYSHIASNGTVTLKSGAGHLHTLVVNAAGSSETITIYDNTSASGTIIAIMTPPAAGTYMFDVAFNTGLTIVTSGTTAGDYTVSWR